MKNNIILIKTIALYLLLFSLKNSYALEISPSRIDIGEIEKGRIIKKTITIKNNESKAVVLKNTRASCECITISYKKRAVIEKNGTFAFDIEINTKEQPRGKLKKFIFLSFQNSEKPIYSVELHANIFSP